MDVLVEKVEVVCVVEFQVIVDDICIKVVEYGIIEKDIFGMCCGWLVK